jgi:uncharacterized membrane protein (TIGR02234 family)
VKLAHHLLSLAGGFAVLMLGTVTWWQGTLTTGGEIAISGSEAEPVVWSLTLAAGAAYAAALLLRRAARRVAQLVQAVAAFVGAILLLASSGFPAQAVASAIETQTGLVGPIATEGLSSLTSTGAEGAAAVALVAMSLGGVLGLFTASERGGSDKYARNTDASKPGDAIGTWDSLSEGQDPTTL